MRGNLSAIESSAPDDLSGPDTHGDGPIRRARCLNLDEVDTCRKLDCGHYDACLARVIPTSWPSWECPSQCCSYQTTPMDVLVPSPDQALVCHYIVAVAGLS